MNTTCNTDPAVGYWCDITGHFIPVSSRDRRVAEAVLSLINASPRTPTADEIAKVVQAALTSG